MKYRNAGGIESVLNSLIRMENVNVYVTGSKADGWNEYMLYGGLAVLSYVDG
ncbi:MAG: hypothetical protein LUH07_05235 [Lachnospiraceae bacterium]|nr:hypothetical protein [Lachnospiraceae bacterium]